MGNIIRLFQKASHIIHKRIKAISLIALFIISLALTQTLAGANEIAITAASHIAESDRICLTGNEQLVNLGLSEVFCIKTEAKDYRLELIPNNTSREIDNIITSPEKSYRRHILVAKIDNNVELKYKRLKDPGDGRDFSHFESRITIRPDTYRVLIFDQIGKIVIDEEIAIDEQDYIFSVSENEYLKQAFKDISPDTQISENFREAIKASLFSKLWISKRRDNIAVGLENFAKNIDLDVEHLDYCLASDQKACPNKQQPTEQIQLTYYNPNNSLIGGSEPKYIDIARITYEELGITRKTSLKDRENIANSLRQRIIDATEKYRESLCENSSQIVKIKWQNRRSELPLFCVKAIVQKDESVSSRASRINNALNKLLTGEINIENIGISPIANLDQQDISDYTLQPDEDAYAIVDYGQKADTPKPILIVTELDVKLLRLSDNSNLNNLEREQSPTNTIIEAPDPATVIDDYFSKIVAAVKNFDQEDASVYFNFGVYNTRTPGFLFHRYKFEKFIKRFRKESSTSEYSNDDDDEGSLKRLFTVEKSNGDYNAHYRAAKIGNKINSITSKALFRPHHIGIFVRHQSNKPTKIQDTSALQDILTLAEDATVFIGEGKNPALDRSIMTIDPDRRLLISNKEEEEDAILKEATIISDQSFKNLIKIKKQLDIYRCNTYLTIELMLICSLRGFYYLFCTKENDKLLQKNLITFFSIVLIPLHMLIPVKLFTDLSIFRDVYSSFIWIIILFLITAFLIFELFQTNVSKKNSKAILINKPYRKILNIIYHRKALNFIRKPYSITIKYLFRLFKCLKELRYFIYVLHFILFSLCIYILADISMFGGKLSRYFGIQQAEIIKYFNEELLIVSGIIIGWMIGFYILSLLILVFFQLLRNRSNPFNKKEFWFYFINWGKIDTHPEAIIHVIAIISVILLIVILTQYFPGSGTPYFAGASAITGLIFTWSASASIADVISGIILIFFTDIEEGDWLRIGTINGQLKDQNLLVHQIKTTKNNIITVPNSKVLQEVTINHTSSHRVGNTGSIIEALAIIHTTVTIGYDVPSDDVESALKEAANLTEDLLSSDNIQNAIQNLKDSKLLEDKKYLSKDKRYLKRFCEAWKKEHNKKNLDPFVLIKSLDDFYISYELNAYLNPRVCLERPKSIPSIYSDLHKNIQRACLLQGIEILSPHYEAGRSGNDHAVPDDYAADFIQKAKEREKVGRLFIPGVTYKRKNREQVKEAGKISETKVDQCSPSRLDKEDSNNDSKNNFHNAGVERSTKNNSHDSSRSHIKNNDHQSQNSIDKKGESTSEMKDIGHSQ